MSDAYPQYEFQRITDITVEDIGRMGAKAVAIDLDNTTVFDSSFRFPRGVKDWVHGIRDAGIPMIILSNTYTFRAWILAQKLGGLDWLSMADKPHTEGYRRAAEILGVDVSEIAMIGDRLFTDVMGANKAGAISVKVEPFEPEKLLAGHYRRVRAQERAYLERRKKGKRDEP